MYITELFDLLKANEKSCNTISKYKRDSRMYANKIPNVMVETALMILDFTHLSLKTSCFELLLHVTINDKMIICFECVVLAMNCNLVDKLNKNSNGRV